MISYDAEDRGYRILYPSYEEMQEWWRKITYIKRDLRRDDSLQQSSSPQLRRDSRRRA